MNLFSLLIGIMLTFFSTVTLGYISMATMMGPWIAPTIVIIAGLLIKLQRSHSPGAIETKRIVLIQTMASTGGIMATAVGFTLPTLYFLDKSQFEQLLSTPVTFSLLISFVAFAAGSMGMVLARAFSNKLIKKEVLPFPISHLIYKTISSQNQWKQAKQLIAGFSASTLVCFFRDTLQVGKNLFLFRPIFHDKLHIMLMPMLWAIGFIVGTSIALPLLVGLLSKYLIAYPLNHHSRFLPWSFFPVFDQTTFTQGFCGGLILAGVTQNILKYPGIIWKSIRQYTGVTRLSSSRPLINKLTPANLKSIGILALPITLLSLLRFPIHAQIIILTLTVIATYQISVIGGKIGLVQIGRFVTFVMLPTMMCCKLTPLQITLLCVFVASCAAATSDLLFDYKVGELCRVSYKQIERYQWLGILMTALLIGATMWLLFTHLQVGTAELFAQRGKLRALLIQSFDFNLTIIFLGFLFGLLLNRLKLSPTMVFSGMLMPNGLTIGLLIGSLGTLLVKEKQDYFPIASGIFAGESIWLILGILVTVLLR